MIEVGVARDGIEEDAPPSAPWIEEIVLRAVRAGGGPGAGEVSVLLTKDEQIKELNLRYRGQDKPTDVLSFALEEESSLQLPPGCPRQLGEVILSLDTIARQAHEHGQSVAQECAWALCHGVLHLLGYDHRTDEEEEEMRSKEQEVLCGLAETVKVW